VSLAALDGQAIRALAAGEPILVDGAEVRWPDDDRRMLRYRVEALDLDPGCAPYLLHVLLDAGRVVARIGCHEGPHAGMVEIGYFVVPAFRGAGVATAVVAEFLEWLAAEGVERVRASVGSDNVASRALLDRFGFTQVGERWDDEDGLELVLERPLGRPLRSSGGTSPCR